MDKERIGIIICSIAIVAILAIMVWTVIPKNNKVNVEQNNIENKINLNELNNIQNTETTNMINEIAENKTNNQAESSVNTDENISTSSEIKIQQPDNQYQGKEEQETSQNSTDRTQTEEEEVLELARNKWGKDDQEVSYNIANRSGNTYIVSVNNKQTTEVKVWYKIDISTKKVTQQ